MHKMRVEEPKSAQKKKKKPEVAVHRRHKTLVEPPVL